MVGADIGNARRSATPEWRTSLYGRDRGARGVGGAATPACFQSPILTEHCRLSNWSSSETVNWAHLKYGHARLPTRLRPATDCSNICLLDRHSSGAPVHLSYDSCNEYPQRFTLRLFGLPESAIEAGQPLTHSPVARAARHVPLHSCGPPASGLAITYLGLPPGMNGRPIRFPTTTVRH